MRFGLKDVNELPSIEEFERLASELTEAVQEDGAMVDMPPSTRLPVSVAEVAREEPMRAEHSAQADGVPENESAAPADNAAVDGRMSGVPPRYDEPGNTMDSPAQDAAVQRDAANEEQLGNRGSDD